MFTQPLYSISASITKITASTNVVSIPENQQRQTLILAPSGSATAFVLYGTGTPSPINYSYAVTNTIIREPDYKGPIKVVFESANGSALILTDCVYT